MKVSVYKTDGTESGKSVELHDEIFGIEPNETVLYEDVRRILAHKRQGTAKTKERGEVRGGGKKAYKQKGTGMARRGSIRSPLLKGGGTVFGPRPHAYKHGLSKKQRRLARKSAFSLKASDEAIKVVEAFSFDVPKTKDILAIFTALDVADKKVLLLIDSVDKNVYKSASNLRNVEVVEAALPSTYQVMKADVLIIQDSAIDRIEQSFGLQNEEVAA
ncbi:MAG: 50S ribosomal protein L4 [Balneolaceae bacterium]